MGYFNHPLWELIFSILGNSGRSPGAHWRTSYLDKADIPCPRTCLGEDDAFTGDLYVQWNSKESVLEKDETELDAKEADDSFQDEAHIIYVNSRKQEDTELGRLMHDLHCKNADEMHSPVLAKRVHELKDTQKGVELMCHEMEKIYSEGMESGELKAKKETALSLAEMGLSVEKIAKAVNHNVNEVQKWIDENLCAIK